MSQAKETSVAKMQGMCVGLVLAGGRSSRFGAEKGAVEFAGRPLLDWAATNLRAVASDIAVSARPGSQAEALARKMGLIVLHDPAGRESGPLWGVLAGLAWARAQGARWLYTLPCDVPFVPADLHVRLLSASSATHGAYVTTPRGAESLCALWPVSGLPALREMLVHGHPPVRDVHARLNAVPVFFEDAFHNINTPEELAALESFRKKKPP